MKTLKDVKGLILLAFAVTAGMALLGTAASASGSAGGPLAQSAGAATHHIPLSKASGAKPRSLKGVPAKGNYAFLLKLNVQSTGIAYNANLPRGHSAARVAAADQLATVRAAQSRVIAALPSGSHVLYQTHAVLAGVAVYTNVKNLPALQRISGVSRVYGIAPKTPSLSYSVELEHGPQVWQNYGDTGEGSSIAVIDTGVDYTHADFGGTGDEGCVPGRARDRHGRPRLSGSEQDLRRELRLRRGRVRRHSDRPGLRPDAGSGPQPARLQQPRHPHRLETLRATGRTPTAAPSPVTTRL